MSTFKNFQARQAEIKSRLVETSGVDPDLAEKVIHYGTQLVLPNTASISDNTFISEMMTRFQITDTLIVSRMFQVLHNRTRENAKLEKETAGKKTDFKVKGQTAGQNDRLLDRTSNLRAGANNRVVNLEDFLVCVCVFLSDRLDLKIDWVFSVYDANGDGSLSKLELYYFLKPSILVSDDMDADDAVKELIHVVMSVVDMNKNGSVDQEEFRTLVKHNILYIDLLGQCLPHKHVLKLFEKNVLNKTPMELSKMFQEEREKGLILIPVHKKSQFFPIHFPSELLGLDLL